MSAARVTWSAPVRYAEVDQQGIVFNAHYLLYCDEAVAAFCDQRGLRAVSAELRLVASALQWTSGARWGEVVEVDVQCDSVGRTSIRIRFEIGASGRACCTVETTYVYTDADGIPRPVPDDVRAALLNPAE